MKYLRPGIAMLMLLASSAGMAQISPAEFTARFVSNVAQASPDIAIDVIEPLHLTATGPSGNEVTAFLGNAYELYEQDRDQLDEILDLYAASLMDTMAQGEESLSPADIVPVIKDSAWLAEAIGATFEGRDQEVPEYFQAALVDGLTIIYAEDTPNNIRYIEKQSIVELGIDISAIRALAINNLLARLPDISVEGGDGLYMIIADGTYEASLLLVDEIWTTDNFAVNGEIVVALPARDVLLVSGTDNTQQLDKLIAISAQVYSESPYYLTQQLYVRRNDRWALFDADRTSK